MRMKKKTDLIDKTKLFLGLQEEALAGQKSPSVDIRMHLDQATKDLSTYLHTYCAWCWWTSVRACFHYCVNPVGQWIRLFNKPKGGKHELSSTVTADAFKYARYFLFSRMCSTYSNTCDSSTSNFRIE